MWCIVPGFLSKNPSFVWSSIGSEEDIKVDRNDPPIRNVYVEISYKFSRRSSKAQLCLVY